MQHSSNEPEIWKPVPGWEGLYEVSDLGRVKSLPRLAKIKNGKTRKTKERIRTLTSGTAGRLMVGFRLVDRIETWQVHRVVLTAFIGPCPDGMEACHNNGDHLDNRLENLRWDTRASNVLDLIKHKSNPAMRKTHCLRGHILAPQNLTPSSRKKGRRGCLACSRAQSYISYHTYLKEEFQTISDSYYREIMEK